jgi:fucose 4-O-acetylase-like acetyltransferase
MTPDRVRRCDVDWLRIGATLLLFPFHAARPFDHQPWHVKSPAMSDAFDVFVWFIHQFHMPLFFVLAGWSLERSLGSRRVDEVRRERVARLLVPFLVGVILLSPPQAYVEAVTQHGFTGGYLAFLPWFFTSLEYFSWHHLWFLLYLFTFTMLYVRPLSRLRPPAVARAWHVWIATVPLAVVQVALRWRWPGHQNLYDDWANVCWYSLLFAAGFVLGRSPVLEAEVRRQWRHAAVVFAVGILAMLPILDALRERVVVPGPGYVGYWVLSAVVTVAALVALLGGSARLADVEGRRLGALREAALPVYVLHQPVIVLLGYGLVAVQAPLGARYLGLLVASLAVTFVVYGLLVRRSRVLRAALGMRAATRQADARLVGAIVGERG